MRTMEVLWLLSFLLFPQVYQLHAFHQGKLLQYKFVLSSSLQGRKISWLEAKTEKELVPFLDHRRIANWKDMRQYRRYRRYKPTEMDEKHQLSQSIHQDIVWFQRLIQSLRELSAKIEFFYDRHIVICRRRDNSILASTKQEQLTDETMIEEYQTNYDDKLSEIRLKQSIRDIFHPKPPPI